MGSFRTVERRGKGRLRPRRNEDSGNAGIGGERCFRASRTGSLCSECIREKRLVRLSLPVFLRSDWDARTAQSRDTARRRNWVRLRYLGNRRLWTAATASNRRGSGGLSHGAGLLGQL